MTDTPTPHRPRLLTDAMRRVGQAELAEVAADEVGREIEEGIRRTATDDHRVNIAKRSAARRDACIVVSRAIARRGPLTGDAWTVDDADTVWAIADLLLLRQGQTVTAVDPAFRPGDIKGSMAVEALEAAVRASPD
jgi:hypothetical protein